MTRVADVTNAAELPAILSAVLGAADNHLATSSTVAIVMRYIRDSAIDWRAWYDESTSDATLALFIPGGVTSIMFSTPKPESGGTFAAAMDHVLSRRDYFVQAIIDCDDSPRAAALAERGLGRLTTLAYLERDAVYPWTESCGRFSWSDWTTAGESRFAAAVAGTYVESVDCPELVGARPVSAALASHRAAGVFAPALWQIATDESGVDVGCVLLTVDAAERASEVTYLGVSAAHRGAGAGAELLSRAVELSRGCGARRMRVAVDVRNAAALRLYARHGFREFARRDVWWRMSPRCGAGCG